MSELESVYFRDATCKWHVSRDEDGNKKPDELHVRPLTLEVCTQLQKAIGSQVLRGDDNTCRRVFNVLREEDGTFILTTDRRSKR